ncbi:MAG: hypothetical protein FWG99_05265 [Treponema sp.]|nr:hypothetical protein [Treponema sp.]
MCWYCGTPVTEKEPFGRSQVCPSCGKDLRACKNCRFFLPGSRGDCSETSAEPAADKERSNFCDWFSLDKKYRIQSAGRAEEQNRAGSARTEFDNLFK